MKNKNLFLLKIFLFIFFGTSAFTFFFVPVYLREQKNFSVGMIGTLSAFASLFGAISQVFIGYLSDKFRKRKPFLLISAFFLTFIYFFIFPRINSFIIFLLLYLLLGICFNSLITLSNVLIFDYSISENIGKTFANTRVWAPIGFLIIMIIIGIYPKLTEPNIMFPIIGSSFLTGFFIITLLKEPNLKAETKIIELKDVKRLITKPDIRNLLVFFIFYIIALSGIAGNVNLLIKHLKGTNSDISWALSVCAFTEIPTTFLWGYLSDKIGRKPLLIFTSLVLPIRVFLYSLARNALDVILIQLFTHSFTFVIIANIPLLYINDLTLEEERATAQGILSMAMAISQTIALLISGNIVDIIGFKGMYIFLTFIALISTFFALSNFRKTKAVVSG